jgi:hypothetical protein
MTHPLAAALVLQLHNLAGAPPVVVAAAASETTRLYAAIGVDVAWRTGAPSEDGSEAAIRVIVLPRETGDLQRTADAVMGAVVPRGSRASVAYIFYRRVRTEAERNGASIVQVLACAIAHELGHLLMPEAGHSSIGLMRARWCRDDFTRADQGQLRFSTDEIALIRSRVDEAARRRNEATPEPEP